MAQTTFDSDTAALEAAGKKQQLKREWNFFSVLGMSTITLCTWEGISALFAAAYVNGGPASVVYGFIVSVVGMVFVTASLAEMASISPIAGAQYHWTAEHAPRRYRASISYFLGWITITGWIAATASVCFLVATLTMGMVVLNYPDFTPQRWQETLLMILVAVLIGLGNTVGKKLLPLWESLAGTLHVLVFFIIWVAVLATSKKASAKDVWGTFINAGGWSSDGVSFCLGFVTPAFALGGVDGVVHLSEETHQAPKNIPRAMVWSVVINGVVGFVYIIAILYAITNVQDVLSTPTSYPIIAVFQQAFNSNAAATAATAGITLILGMQLFGALTSVSRLIWAFSRDKGLVFSDFFTHVTEWNKCPTNCVVLCVVTFALLSLINIGSTTAFNALISLATLGFYISYATPIVFFAIRRFDTTNPIVFGPWNLGRFGLGINILAVAFCIFLIIFLPFPAYLPVTSTNMNYSSAVFGGVLILAIINYVVRAHKRFTGPIREVSSETSSELTEGEAIDEKQ